MEYKHVTLIWSLDGLSPSKFIADLKSEGFEGLYSKVLPVFSDFFGRADPFGEYKKIISHFKQDPRLGLGEDRIINIGDEIIVLDDGGKIVRRYNREQEPLSFGELFRNEKYKNIVFAVEDDSHTIHDSSKKKVRIWISCWSNGESNNSPLDEPLNAFTDAVLKASGCDQPIEKIVDSNTFSLSHSKMMKELEAYNLKQATFEEQKDVFKVISDDKIREILIEFNKKHNILLSEFSKDGEENASLERKLNFLSGKGLLEKNLIVICKKTNQWWNMTIPSREMLTELEKSGIKCSSCGAKITDEKIDNLYKISEKGAKLVDGSYWMVGRVVDALCKLGTRNSDIFADILYEGDQIDIMALSMVNWLVFELKDREFGLGDAYKFHGKISRLRQKSSEPIVPVIITTKTVAAEARKLLSEVNPPIEEYRRRQNQPIDYIFVEGLENIETQIAMWVNDRRREAIIQRINTIGERFPSKKIYEILTDKNVNLPNSESVS